MVDATSNQPASAQAPIVAPPDNVEPTPGDTRPAEPSAKPVAAPLRAGASSAATIDELLAKEALANLKRTRAAAHLESEKAKARVVIPPAKLVVRPPTSQAWMRPFLSLAAIVGLSTSLCAGGLAYLFLQPASTTRTSDAELRSLRDSVAQLRRNVADLSSDVATARTALAAASKISSERPQLAQEVERTKRDQPPAGRTERLADNGAPAAKSARPEPASDITGAIQSTARATEPRPDVITGWRVRRAYGDTAVLEGRYGVIEVVLGQDLPNLGRIQDIKYDNGRWQVLTSSGIITSAP